MKIVFLRKKGISMMPRKRKNTSIERTEQEIYKLLKVFDEYSEEVAVNRLREESKKEGRTIEHSRRVIDYAREERLGYECQESIRRFGGSTVRSCGQGLSFRYKEALAMVENNFLSAGAIHLDYIQYLCKDGATDIYNYLLDNYLCEEIRPGTLKLKEI